MQNCDHLRKLRLCALIAPSRVGYWVTRDFVAGSAAMKLGKHVECDKDQSTGAIPGLGVVVRAIGSGAIESIRRVINLQMKSNCMFWRAENAEAMLSYSYSYSYEHEHEHEHATGQVRN